MSTLEERYEAIRARVPAGVKLVAVSKTRSVEEIQALYDLGQRAFGENYHQELRDKQPALPADIEWHFIGHLQTNKVKYLAPFVHLVHAVDSGKLMQELEKRAAANDRTIGALLQVHIADEETKHGLAPDELLEAVRSWPWNEWPHVEVRGLMAMATFTDDLVQVRREFDAVARLFGQVKALGVFPADRFTELSLGMTSDLDEAIAAGSTLVRVGTAIFGERPSPAGNP